MSRILKTSNITAGASMPIKKGTLDFLYAELAEIRRVIINEGFGANAAANDAYIINGLELTIAGTSYAFTAGYLYYQDKIYYVPSATITVSGSNIPVFNQVITNETSAIADPVKFSNGSNYDVHEIYSGTITANTSGSGLIDWANVKYWNHDWVSWVDAAVAVDAYWAIRRGCLIFKGYLKKSTASLPYNVLSLPTYARPFQDVVRRVIVSNVGAVDAKYFNAGYVFRIFTGGTAELRDMWADTAGSASVTGAPLISGLDTNSRLDLTSVVPIPLY